MFGTVPMNEKKISNRILEFYYKKENADEKFRHRFWREIHFSKMEPSQMDSLISNVKFCGVARTESFVGWSNVAG